MKRILTRVGGTVLVLAVLAGLFMFALSVAPRVTYEYEPFSMEPVVLPDSRLLALGTCTHGNAEPFEAAEWLLEQMLEEHGSAALILEENVGETPSLPVCCTVSVKTASGLASATYTAISRVKIFYSSLRTTASAFTATMYR